MNSSKPASFPLARHAAALRTSGTIVALGTFMAPRNDTTPRARAPRSVAFLYHGPSGLEERRVDLRAPRAIRRSGRWMVQLIDLWVASLLPLDVLDLSFEVVATGPGGEAVRSVPLDGLCLARGYVAVATQELWWDGQRAGTPHGLRLQSIVARDCPAPELKKAPLVPPVTLERLARVLPHAVTAYPSVEWRSAPDETPRNPLHAYLLALGLLCTACGSSTPASHATASAFAGRGPG